MRTRLRTFLARLWGTTWQRIGPVFSYVFQPTPSSSNDLARVRKLLLELSAALGREPIGSSPVVHIDRTNPAALTQGV